MPNTDLENRLVNLAIIMKLSPMETRYLPQLITTASESTKMTDNDMILFCEQCSDLCDYLASVCRDCAK